MVSKGSKGTTPYRSHLTPSRALRGALCLSSPLLPRNRSPQMADSAALLSTSVILSFPLCLPELHLHSLIPINHHVICESSDWCLGLPLLILVMIAQGCVIVSGAKPNGELHSQALPRLGHFDSLLHTFTLPFLIELGLEVFGAFPCLPWLPWLPWPSFPPCCGRRAKTSFGHGEIHIPAVLVAPPSPFAHLLNFPSSSY